MVTSAQAQLKRSQSMNCPAPDKSEAPINVIRQSLPVPGEPVLKAPKKADNVKLGYNRPAGAFPASISVVDGVYVGFYSDPYLTIKPYADYHFIGEATGVSENAVFSWDVQNRDLTNDNEQQQQWVTVSGKVLTWQWGNGVYETPVLNVVDGNNVFYTWQYGYGSRSTGNDPLVPGSDKWRPAKLLSVPTTLDIWGEDILKCSKNFCFGGVNGDQRYPFISYTGLDPTDDQIESQMSDGGYSTPDVCVGYWFGKNKGTVTRDGVTYTRRIDGIGQAFEKPEHPYLLNSVSVLTSSLDIAAGQQVEMNCKIYKLDKMAEYGEAILPEEPGELIAYGVAILNDSTSKETGGLITFTLMGVDPEVGLVIDITPTIDFPILVAIDGYNDPEMAALTDFSAMCSTDDQVDEGFGELAYVKYGRNDEEGNFTGTYNWVGLYNLWELKTGLTILLSTENPYIAFNNKAEDGKYLFPDDGGQLEIQFLSSMPSVDDDWILSCDGSNIPDWLTIELTDGEEDGEYNGLVNAEVSAKPLPKGVRHREAIVRFEIPGAYLDYKFMQERELLPVDPNVTDWNNDGNVNISDVNLLIEMLLSGDYDLDISYINRLIHYILTH